VRTTAGSGFRSSAVSRAGRGWSAWVLLLLQVSLPAQGREAVDPRAGPGIRIVATPAEVTFGAPFQVEIERSWPTGWSPEAPPEDLLDPLETRLLGSCRKENGGVVRERLQFQARGFLLGPVALPSLSFRAHPPGGAAPVEARSGPLLIQVISALPEGVSTDEAEIPRDLLMRPPEAETWSAWWLWPAAGGILLALLILRRRSQRRRPEEEQEDDPLTLVLELERDLAGSAAGGREAALRLSRLAKTALSRRLGESVSGMTRQEIGEAVAATPLRKDEVVAGALDLLQRLEDAIYGGEAIPRAELPADLELVRTLLSAPEGEAGRLPAEAVP